MTKVENIDPIQNKGELHSLLKDVKRLVTDPENREELDQILQVEMERVNASFDALDINQEHAFHYPKFCEVIGCFETYSSTLTQMMYVVGKFGKGQEIDCIIDFLKSRSHQVLENFHELDREVVNLKLLPLVAVVAGYGLGLLSSQRISVFHKFFESKTRIQNFDNGSRVSDYLLTHVWEGRIIKLWKYFIPEGSMEPSLSIPDVHNIMLTKLAFLNYLSNKLELWLSSEIDSDIKFGSLMCNYKVLGSLIYLEKFENNDMMDSLYNCGKLDYTFFRFEHNTDFYDSEVSLIDNILTQEYLDSLKNAGFKRVNKDILNSFKQFYVELHYLSENWSEIILNSKSDVEKVQVNKSKK